MKQPKQPEEGMSPELKKKSSSVGMQPSDFHIREKIGRGAYGDVYLVERKSNQQIFAMKQIQKRKL